MTIYRMIVSVCFSVLVAVAPVKSETLADALRDAYHSSGLLDQNRALLRAADEDVAQSLAALRPIITYSAQLSYFDSFGGSSTSFGGTSTSSGVFSGGGFSTSDFFDNLSADISLSGSLLLYDGGSSALATEAQKEIVLQTRQGLIQIEQEVLLRAVTAYMEVRRQAGFVNLRQSNVRVLGQELQAAQDRFEVGEVTRTDVASAQARLAAARSLLAASEGALAQANEEFLAVVGRYPGELDDVSPATLQQDLEAARAYAVRNHPDVIGAQHSVAAAELNIRRAQTDLQPELNLGGSISVDDDRVVDQSINLTYGGTIYQGGQLQSIIRQAQAQRDSSRAVLLVTVQGVNQNVGNAYASLRVARASAASSVLQIEAARTAFQGVREEATLGARTTIEVLNAEQELLDAQADQISAKADEVVASYQVLSTIGLLTAEHLDLGVQSYDPTAYYNLVREAPATLSTQGQALDRVLQSIGD